MNLAMFARVAALSLAAALGTFAFFGGDLLFLAKALSLALAFSIVVTVFYPHVRGIRKGDRVSVVAGGMPTIFGMGRTGFALSDSALNKEVRVKMDDGKEAIGIVEGYEGVLSPPRVRLLYEEKLVE